MKKKLAKILAMTLAVPLGLGLVSGVSFTSASAADASQYVIMNIPYGAFYESETLTDSVAPASIDAVSSATKQKTRAYDLAKGTYHSEDGSVIGGISYPVKVPAGTDLSKYTQVTDSDSKTINLTLRGRAQTTTLTGSSVLFEEPEYSYYITSETPSYYKELIVNADGSLKFGKSTGTHQTVSGVASELQTSTHWGEYQLNINDDEFINSIDTLYGVTLNTTDGKSYGLRDIQNIWRKNELAWNSVSDADPDGSNTSSYKPYQDLMGKTISTVTYYTDKGIYDLDINDTYVPVLSADLEAADAVVAADAKAGCSTTTITTKNLPSDYSPVYEVGEGFSSSGNTLKYKNALPGTYTLKTTDASGKYAPITSTFTLFTDSIPVELNSLKEGLTKKKNTSDAVYANYIKNITSVVIDDQPYNTGRRGTIIVKEDGSIDLSAAPFADTTKTSYNVTIKSAGYPDLVSSNVTVEKKEAPEPAPKPVVKEKQSIAKAKISGVKAKVKYTGKKITQKKLKVKLGKKTLKKNKDYTVSYKNNKKKGKATITIKGKGNYTGKKTVKFRIVK